MFKKLAISICLVMALCTSVYAEQEVIENSEATETTAFTDVKEEIVLDAVEIPSKDLSMDVYLDNLNISLSQKKNLKKPEEFMSIMACSPRAMYENVSDYTAFVCEYNLTDAQLEVINRILDKGTTIQSLIQVYKFWLTTDYDFTMVEEICALEDKYFSEYWYESAFNDITEDVHGVLSIEDINNYRDNGITTDEILAANVLCRKEGQNIFDILDGVCNGVSIEQQVIEIYGVDALPESDSIFKSVSEVAESTARIFNTLTAVVSSDSVVLNKEEISKINYDIVSEKIDTELERLMIQIPEQCVEDDYITLNSIPLPISIKRALLNKGYTPEEIQRVALNSELNLNRAAKKAREALKNEK